MMVLSLCIFLECFQVNGTDVSALKTSELLSLINSETHISLTLFREPSMTLL